MNYGKFLAIMIEIWSLVWSQDQLFYALFESALAEVANGVNIKRCGALDKLLEEISSTEYQFYVLVERPCFSKIPYLQHI